MTANTYVAMPKPAPTTGTARKRSQFRCNKTSRHRRDARQQMRHHYVQTFRHISKLMLQLPFAGGMSTATAQVATWSRGAGVHILPLSTLMVGASFPHLLCSVAVPVLSLCSVLHVPSDMSRCCRRTPPRGGALSMEWPSSGSPPFVSGQEALCTRKADPVWEQFPAPLWLLRHSSVHTSATSVFTEFIARKVMALGSGVPTHLPSARRVAFAVH